MLNNMIDNSLENFLSKLYDCIIHNKIENSFQDFEYKLFRKNKLYNAIESYEKNGTLFYSDFMAKHPEINIKSIRDIKMGEHYHRSLVERVAYSTGTYYLKFTVFYDKKSKNNLL
jgi:hypothetical protein